MTPIELYAYVILPLLVGGLGWLAVVVAERLWRRPKAERDLFDTPQRAMATREGLVPPSRRS